MNLPKRVDDPSLLQHEPLCSYVAMFEALEGESRSASKELVSGFVKAMGQDGQAAAAARKWAYLVFEDDLSGESSFEVTDGGEELYKVFLEYQIRLCQDTNSACEYHAHVFRMGIGVIKLKDHGANTQHSIRGRGSQGRNKGHGNNSRPHKISDPNTVRRQVKTGVQCLDAGLAHFSMMEAVCEDLIESTGDTAISSSPGSGSHSTTTGSATQQEPPFDAPPVTGTRLSILPEAAVKPSKRSRSKKRKASSQKPPLITPSDASEDDKEPSKTRSVTVANSISHRPKRVAPNPCRQPHDLLGVNNQVAKKNLTHGLETNKQHREDTSISQAQSPLTSFQSDDFVSPPSVQGRRIAGFSLSDHKHDEANILNVSTQLEPLPTGPLLTQENTRVESKTRRKRARLEFETRSVVSHENTSADSQELLGPDTRLLRPLPKKVRNGRLVLVADGDTVVRGVPCRAPSLEHADQLLRDVASNALAILREGVEPDIPDWTQDNEYDAECGSLGGHDQDEPNDVQITTGASTLSVVIPKPPVPTPPRIWAQSRQEVCESFEYFRSYHSGVYSKGDIVKGYLLGAYAASRDIFHHGGKLIISHGGGKSESILDPRRGPKRYQTDQDQEASDKSVRALLKTCKDRRPIALLADDKYAHFPYDLSSANYTYVVLGLYWISHAWAECQSARDGSGRVVRWKFAFQWCEGQGEPWWVPRQEITSDPPKPISNSEMCVTKGSSTLANTGGDPSIQCENCQEQSPFIYKQGWMCLNPRCSVFWSIKDEEPKQLDYREEFLNLLPQTFDRLPNIIPARVVETSCGVTTTYAFSKGLHCTKCGRLSCRYKWEHWECSNCQFKHVINGRVRSPKEFWHQRPSKGFLHSQIGKDSGILACRLEPISLGTNKGFTNRLTFILPHDRGKIHLILGTPLSNGDADNIFQLYQQQASTGELKLRRYPLRNVARGPLLTNYFSQNCKHCSLYIHNLLYVGGSGHTVPFREAPDCVRRALALIKERSSIALRTDIPFNEILSAAYMERQKMSFHSDSEKGLGPIVASLSLGSAALMHFRPHVIMENPRNKCTYALTLVLRHSPSTADLIPRLLRSLSKTQPTQQTTPAAVAEQTSVTPIRTPAQVGVATDNGVNPAEWSSQPLHAAQTPIDTRVNDENVDSVVSEDPGQSPEPIVPSTFVKRVQDMLSTIPSFGIGSGSSRPNPPAPSQTEADDTPSPVRDPHILAFLTEPNSETGPFEHGWQSFWSALDRLRLPYGKKPETASDPEPSQDEILDCIDDNNSVMMYGPLEPDDTSEVEIACSEIVVRGKESESEFVSGVTGAAQVSPTEPAADQPPVKEYRVWLPSLTKISVQTMWWGFRIYLPPPVLDVLNNRQLEAAKRAALITTALQWLMDHLPVSLLPPQMRPGVAILRYLVPYVGYMGGFIAWSWSAIRSFDKGYGVVLTATWLLPFVLVPGTWEADQVPTLNTDIQQSPSVSS
ncbi:hypothetical protein J3R83DRAFT_3502 [Lanmaoa asiatica]|nr:hypothetical protein J3R83DRAFT_3502 [Lanmaoa asiatica]